MVRVIKSQADWTALMAESASKAVLVDFWATWCGPCRAIAPTVEAFEKKYTEMIFAKVDVDELNQIAQKEGISAMPSFFVYKNGKKVGELVGASPDRLEQLILKHK